MKFAHVTPGYIGVVKNNLTLNSQFWGQFDNASIMQQSLHLPQRVPRPGFFEEVLFHEGRQTRNEFRQRIRGYRVQHKKLTNSKMNKHSAEILLNLERILIRLGDFDYLSRLSNNHLKSRSIDRLDINTQIKLVRLSAKIYLSLGGDIKPYLNEMWLMWQTVDRLKVETQLNLGIRLIVYSARYSQKSEPKEVSEKIKSLISSFVPKNLYQKSILAMAYRALPMSNHIPEPVKQECMDQMCQLLESTNPSGRTNILLWNELKLTSFLTLSKWFISKKKYQEAQDTLNRITRLDPFDSTGYSELGLFFLDQGLYEKSVRSFGKSVKLGPPGTAMNYYFLGLGHFELGRLDKSKIALLKSTKFDDSAVSPLILLVEIYKSQNKSNLAKKLAGKILETGKLRNQLESTEIEQLKGLV